MKELHTCEELILSKLHKSRRFSLVPRTTQAQLQESPEYQALRKSQRIEEEIRRAKLRDVQRMKEELQVKLDALKENAELLIQSPHVKLAKEPGGLSKEEKVKLRSELEQKRNEAAEFIQKMQQEEKERKRKLRQRKKELHTKILADADEANKLSKQREEEARKKRKEEMARTYQELKQKREEQRKKFEERLAQPLPHPKDDYLYMKLENRFTHDVLTPMLEERKQDLAKKRNYFKPISKDDLEAHQRKYEMEAAAKQEERAQEFHKRKLENEKREELVRKFKTPASEKVSQLELRAKEELEKRKKERLDKRAKMESYANLVKEIVTVKPNEKKAEELKQKIEELKPKVRETRDTRKEYDLAKLNHREAGKKNPRHSTSLSKVKGDVEPNSAAVPGTREDRANEAPHRSAQRGSTKTKSALKVAIQQQEEQRQEQARSKKQDYLAELRRKRDENYGVSKSIKFNWKADLQNPHLNPAEKYSRLVGKANLIEEQAKQKEKLLQAKGGTDKNPEIGEYVSDMFIDAIKAKLAILDNL